MNDKIKQGAAQFFDGFKDEVKEVRGDLDVNKDGKVDFSELKGAAVSETKEAIGKLKEVLSEDDLPDKARAEISEALEKLQDAVRPKLEAKKMEAEIRKEKVKAQIDREKEIREIKKEILD